MRSTRRRGRCWRSSRRWNWPSATRAADRSADRRKPGTARAGQTGALARRGQHDAVEGIRGRHPDHDGANSAVGLRSTPARYIFLDEVDAYPASADEEGDPVTLAEARSLTFAHRRKVFLVSTPTIRGLSRIEREFEASDQRRYFVPCPHCGQEQWLKFERLRWQKGRPETAEYHCEGCERPSPNTTRRRCWRQANGARLRRPPIPDTVGYHLSALYSPIGWLSWERIVRAWDAAQGSDEAIKAFRNTILGETWVETGEAPDWQRLATGARLGNGGTVPAGGLVPDRRGGRSEGPDRGRCLGLGPRAGELADRSPGHRGRARRSGVLAAADRICSVRHGSMHAVRRMTIARLAIDTGYETRRSMPGRDRSASRRWPRSKASKGSIARAR